MKSELRGKEEPPEKWKLLDDPEARGAGDNGTMPRVAVKLLSPGPQSLSLVKN